MNGLNSVRWPKTVSALILKIKFALRWKIKAYVKAQLKDIARIQIKIAYKRATAFVQIIIVWNVDSLIVFIKENVFRFALPIRLKN